MSETATKKKEPGMATLVIVLFAICAATALLLGLTNYVTAPFIAANNEKTTQEAMAAVLPADSYDEVEYTGGDAMVQAVYKAGDAGYVVEVKPATSFSGNLTIMVGVDNTGACSGISITSTGETPAWAPTPASRTSRPSSWPRPERSRLPRTAATSTP